MGIVSDAWQRLTGRGMSAKAQQQAVEALAIFGADDAKQVAHGLLAGALPYSQPPARGTVQMMLLYATAPWLRVVVSSEADRIAQTEWQVEIEKNQAGQAIRSKAFQSIQGTHSTELRRQQVKRAKAAGMQLEPWDDHPILEFIRHGNPVMDGRGCMKLLAIYALLKGEAYFLLERHQSGPLVGLPSAWWPIPPFWIAETPTVNRPYYRIAFMGLNQVIPETEIVRFIDPDPYNWMGRGVGFGQSLTDELDSDDFSKKWIKSRMYNHGVPRTVVVMENASKVEAERIQEEWRQSFQGVFNQFKTWFTPRKLDVKTLEPNFAELKLLEFRESFRDTTLEVFKYPKVLLGITKSTTLRAELDSAEFYLERYGIEPWREFFRHGLQHRLMPIYTDKALLSYLNDVPGNLDRLLSVAKARPYAITNNEARQIGGLDPTDEPWGEERPPTPIAAPVDQEVIQGGSGFGQGKSLRAAIARRRLLAHDPAWTRGLGAKASGEEDDDLFKASDIPDVVAAVDPDEFLPLQDVLAKNIQSIGSKVSGALSATNFDHRDPEVAKHLKLFSGDSISSITDTTKSAIRDALADVAEDGGSMEDAGRAIRDVFKTCSTSRSELIAGTENLRSSGFATQLAGKQSGLELKKVWQHGGGQDHPRDGHEQLAEQEPIDLDDDFEDPETGATMQYPGESGDPASDCNCSCSHWFHTEDPDKAAAGSGPTNAQQQAWRAAGKSKLKTAAKAAFARQQKAVLEVLGR